MKYWIILVTGVLVACGHSRHITQKQQALPGWLQGTWEQRTNTTAMLLETWVKKTDNELTGKSVKINGRDTVLLETITMLRSNDSLFYIPTVSNQNQGKPVKFYCSRSQDSLLVFENPKHDFPQQISYKLITKDSIVATISGLYKGQQRSSHFYMKKK